MPPPYENNPIETRNTRRIKIFCFVLGFALAGVMVVLMIYVIGPDTEETTSLASVQSESPSSAPSVLPNATAMPSISPTISSAPTMSPSQSSAPSEGPTFSLQSDLTPMFVSMGPYLEDNILSGAEFSAWETATSQFLQEHLSASYPELEELQLGSFIVEQSLSPALLERRLQNSDQALDIEFNVAILFRGIRQDWQTDVFQAFENATDRAEYIAKLQSESSAFFDIQYILVERSDRTLEPSAAPSDMPSVSIQPSNQPTAVATSIPANANVTLAPANGSPNTTSAPSEDPNNSTILPSVSPVSVTTLEPTVPPTDFNASGPTPSPTDLADDQRLTLVGSFDLLEAVPHDESAFTEGLELLPGQPIYYESTGLLGESSLRLVDLSTGQVLVELALADEYFAKGLTYVDEKIVLTTWKAQTAFVYSAYDLELTETFSYTTSTGEAWGICYSPLNNVFYVSDGSNNLNMWKLDFVPTSSFDLLRTIPVTMRTNELTEQALREITEMEWDPFTQTILANVDQEDYIVRIDPTDGFVTHRYDLQLLDRPMTANFLNGIAMTDTPNEIWVTGKFWPDMYRIRLVDPDDETLGPSSSSAETAQPSPDTTNVPTESPSVVPNGGSNVTMTPTESPDVTITVAPTESPNGATDSASPFAARFPTASPTTSPMVGNTRSPTLQPVAWNTQGPTAALPDQPLTVEGSYQFLAAVPHVESASTEGMQLRPEQPIYFESTGIQGRSTIRIVDQTSGQVLGQRSIDPEFYAKGLTYADEKIVLMTWTGRTGFVYDPTSLELIESFAYNTTTGEGWGICYSPVNDLFYLSDGSSTLNVWTLDFLPASYEAVRTIPVTMHIDEFGVQPLPKISEMEWDPFTETILANIDQEDYIVRIDPSTGFVTHRYNLESLDRPKSASVLNGIAMTDTPNEIWVTGKFWSRMYRVRLVDE